MRRSISSKLGMETGMPQQNSFDHCPLATDVLTDGVIQNIEYYLNLIGYVPTSGTVIYPLAYGAKLDGTTDDTAAMNALLKSNITVDLGGRTALVSQVAVTNLTDIYFQNGWILGSDRTKVPLQFTGCTRWGWKGGLRISHRSPGIRNAIPGCWGLGCTDFRGLGGVEIFSTAGAGMMFYGCTGGVYDAVDIHDTNADGWHMRTYSVNGLGTTDFVGGTVKLKNCGDDGWVIVSYQADTATICSGNVVARIDAVNMQTNAAAVHGGQDIVMGFVNANGTGDAGIYLAGGELSFPSMALTNVVVQGFNIVGANTQPDRFTDYAAIDILGANAAYPVSGVMIGAGRISGSYAWDARVQGNAAGAVQDVTFKAPVCVGPPTDLAKPSLLLGGSAMGGIVQATVQGYSTALAGAQGLLTSGQVTTLVLEGMQVMLPNQGNNASIYGIQDSSANFADQGGNFVVPDGTKTALSGNIQHTGTGIATSVPAHYTALRLGSSPTIAPSATAGTYGTPLTILPNGGFVSLTPLMYCSFKANTIGAETLTYRTTLTWSDASTTNFTGTATTTATSSFNANSWAAAMPTTQNGLSIVQIALDVTSSINSSTATVTVACYAAST